MFANECKLKMDNLTCECGAIINVNLNLECSEVDEGKHSRRSTDFVTDRKRPAVPILILSRPSTCRQCFNTCVVGAGTGLCFAGLDSEPTTSAEALQDAWFFNYPTAMGKFVQKLVTFGQIDLNDLLER